MNTKQPGALRIADDLRYSIAHYGREDALTFNAYEAEKCLRALHTEKEMLITGYDAARLEIESLHAQLAAVGAGGVEPLRKRECLHTISEPKARSEQEIVDQTEGLAKFLMLWRWGQEPESPAITMRNSINSKAKKSWHAACHIQELLTDTDPENAVAEVDDAITDPQRRKAMNKTAIDLLCEIYDDVVQGALPNPDDAWFENARAALAAAPAQPVAVPAEPVAQVTVSDDDLDMGFSESFISGEIRLPNGTHGLFTAGQMLAYVAADRAARGTAQAANVAGLESAVAHLSCLLDAFRALLVEVDDVCGRDGFDRVLADGESEVIDKIRAALAMTNAAPNPPAQAAAPIKTLTEAIAHAEDKAKGKSTCALEHAKLTAWLTELQLFRAAKRKPLTDAQIDAATLEVIGIFALDIETNQTARMIARTIEAAHSIT